MKTLYILVGKKGSGKSYIGSLIDRELDIHFFRVEDLWLKLNKDDYSSYNEYIETGTQKVEEHLEQFFQKYDSISIESTASMPRFDKHLDRLKSKYTVKLIHINTPAALCLKRIKTRDQSIHIPVSDEKIKQINQAAECNLKNIEFDLVINNDNKNDEDIIGVFKTILN